MNNLQGIFSEFASACIGKVKGEGDIAHPQKLRRDLLDFSKGSLKHIDAYLSFVHINQKGMTDKEYSNTVLWCGAYDGEVIRKNATRKLIWMDYEEYMEKRNDPKLRNMLPRGLTTSAFLVDQNNNMTMPVNKVARFLNEGPENSIEYYAAGEIERQ